eukprot:TRINITY_DN1740_c0_g1_i1.p1 TRINITY_DN1740_c0_g1~~TRINITY_DN1740_c0_g1_i1.p1  ORF type:complete len:180 (+),score=32.84 TRINITY_DN1740_c0_g1_i1:240-779(+)
MMVKGVKETIIPHKKMEGYGNLSKIEVHASEKDIVAIKEFWDKSPQKDLIEYWTLYEGGIRNSDPDENSVSISPYFTIKDGNLEKIKGSFSKFYELTNNEEGCQYYAFSVREDGKMFHCREAYKGAEGLLAHLGNVSEPLGEVLKLADLEIEVHANKANLEALAEPLAPHKPRKFVILQ